MIIPVSLSLLWTAANTKNIYKITENSHFAEEEEVECLINIFSGRYFTDGCLQKQSLGGVL